jgi:predicted nucleic acid-binding Zn finger protein
MVLELSTALAMRCPTCGRLDINQLNIFQLSGDIRHEIYCECGSHKMTVSKKRSDYIVVEYYCIICDYEHSVVLPGNKFWSKNHLSSLSCLETNLNLGYFGPYRLIAEKLEKQQEELDSMADELGYDDFSDPELILAILDYLHDIAANGNLFCECGSHDINIDLSSEKVKLICNNCRASYVVPVNSRKELDRLKKLDELVLDFQPGATKNPRGPWINI